MRNLYDQAVTFTLKKFREAELRDDQKQYLIKHAMRVAERLRKLGLPEYVVIAGLMHDVIEDTGATFAEINERFGYQIACLTYSVTDEPGKNRRERKEKTFPKIMSNQHSILIKLCDRIDNVEQCLLKGDDKINMYRKEHNQFRDALRCKSGAEELWTELDALLERGHERVRENRDSLQR